LHRIRKSLAGDWQNDRWLDKANTKLVHWVDELCDTSGEDHAEIAIAVVRRPPVAVHALRVEIAEIDEVAVSGARIRPCVDIGQ